MQTEIRNDDLSDDVVMRHSGDLAARAEAGLRFSVVEPLYLGAEASYDYIPDSDFITIGAVVGMTF